MTYKVDATSLNLRSKPEVNPATRIALLYRGGKYPLQLMVY